MRWVSKELTKGLLIGSVCLGILPRPAGSGVVRPRPHPALESQAQSWRDRRSRRAMEIRERLPRPPALPQPPSVPAREGLDGGGGGGG